VTNDAGPAFEWRLREAMALKGMWHTNDLVEPLAARGVVLSRSQVFRLVTGTPERVSIPLLLALCDILDCRFEDLAVPVEAPSHGRGRPVAKKAARRQAAGAEGLGDPVPPEFFTDTD
jgi:DNA-binding Xre family transcriptional regulator